MARRVPLHIAAIVVFGMFNGTILSAADIHQVRKDTPTAAVLPPGAPIMFSGTDRYFGWNTLSVGDVLMEGRRTDRDGCEYPNWQVTTQRMPFKKRTLTFESDASCRLVVTGKRETQLVFPYGVKPQLDRSARITSRPYPSLLRPVAGPVARLAPQCTPQSGYETHSEFFGRDFTYQDVFEVHSHLVYDYDCMTSSISAGYGQALAIDWYWGAFDNGDNGGQTYNIHSGAFWTNYDSGSASATAYGSATGAYVQCQGGGSGFSYTNVYQFSCW